MTLATIATTAATAPVPRLSSAFVAPRWRAALGLLLVAATLRAVGPAEIAQRLSTAHCSWVALGVVLALPQLLLLALRWRLTAAALGISLDYAVAVREYALSSFLNHGAVGLAAAHGVAVSLLFGSIGLLSSALLVGPLLWGVRR